MASRTARWPAAAGSAGGRGPGRRASVRRGPGRCGGRRRGAPEPPSSGGSGGVRVGRSGQACESSGHGAPRVVGDAPPARPATGHVGDGAAGRGAVRGMRTDRTVGRRPPVGARAPAARRPGPVSGGQRAQRGGCGDDPALLGGSPRFIGHTSSSPRRSCVGRRPPEVRPVQPVRYPGVGPAGPARAPVPPGPPVPRSPGVSRPGVRRPESGPALAGPGCAGSLGPWT